MKNKKKNSKGSKGKKKPNKVIVPSRPSEEKVPDFTTRAIENSNSKRIRTLRGIEKLIPTLKKGKELKVSLPKLIDADYVADSLLPKIAKRLDLASKGIILKPSKIELVTRSNGTETKGVTEISLSKK